MVGRNKVFFALFASWTCKKPTTMSIVSSSPISWEVLALVLNGGNGCMLVTPWLASLS